MISHTLLRLLSEPVRPADDDDHDEPSLDAQLGLNATSAMSAASSFGLDGRAIACFARWWQLETYLRDLLYIELGAAFGVGWQEIVSPKAGRQERTMTETRYMPSAHDSFPISHLSTADLLKLLEKYWDHVGSGIGMPLERWKSRVEEVYPIRNRIAHLRPPHQDDLGRIEQLLRDLEKGARVALGSYVNGEPVHADAGGQVVEDWIVGRHEAARRLFKHGRDQYDVQFRLQRSYRPWLVADAGLSPVDGVGMYWVLSLFVGGHARGHLDLRDYLAEPAVQRSVGAVGHIIDTAGHLIITLPACNPNEMISNAIANCYEMVFHHLTADERTNERLHRSDPRVDADGPLTVLSWIDPNDSFTMFDA
jgi:hypothetical protein